MEIVYVIYFKPKKGSSLDPIIYGATKDVGKAMKFCDEHNPNPDGEYTYEFFELK